MLFFFIILFNSSQTRGESLITCTEGKEDTLIYLMEFSSPFSDLCKNFDPHSRTLEETPYFFF